MSHTSKPINELEILDNIPMDGTVVVESTGHIKRVPITKINPIRTAIIEGSDFTAEVRGYVHSGEVTYQCNNMTYNEAYDLLVNQKGLEIIIKHKPCENCIPVIDNPHECQLDCLEESSPIKFGTYDHVFRWYPDNTITKSEVK